MEEASPRLLSVALGVAVVALDLNFRTRAAGDGAADGLDLQNGAKFAAWTAMLVLGVLEWRTIAALVRRDAALKALSAFATFALLSCLWSPVPAYTAACAVGQFGWAAFALVLAVRLPDRDVAMALAVGLGLEVGLGLAAAVVAPELAWMAPSPEESGNRLQGLSGHANLIAQHAALLVLALLALRDLGGLRRRWLFAGLAAAGLAMVLSDSRTTMVAVVVACAIAAARRSPLRVEILLLAAAAFAAFAWLKAVDLVPDAASLFGGLSRSGAATEISTLTGRTDLWQIAWGHFLERPLGGWGFNGTERLMADSVEANFPGDPVNAHNMALQSLMTVGLVGSAPLLAYLAILVRRQFVTPDAIRDRHVAFLLVLGISEAENVTVPVLISFCLFWAMARDARGAAGGPAVEVGHVR